MTGSVNGQRGWRGDLAFLLLVLAAGIALRLLWLVQVHGGLDVFMHAAEATNVALAFARTGSIADAYFPGQGPTAHLLPLNPAIAGTILRMLEPGSTAAGFALLAWSLGQSVAVWLLLRRLFAELDAPAAVLRWGTALLALVPVFAPQEVIDFQYWEGGSAACLAALNLLLVVRLDRRRQLSARRMVAAALLAALTVFVSPPVGLAVGACWATVALLRLPFGQSLRLALTAAMALVLVIAPWAYRNQQQLGAPVLLRSNLGLELAVANHPAALGSRPPEQVFGDRLLEVSPAANAAARAAVAQPGGELRYMAAVGARTRAWMADNPAGVARLYLRHLREFFAPSPWQMLFSGWSGMRVARALAIGAINLGGLAALLLLARRRRGYWILALYLAALSLPYALFQPTARYIYLGHGLLAFLLIAGLHTGLHARCTTRTKEATA